VFANTRERVKHLTASLRERGFSVVGLSGELTQSQRSEALQALRDGHARVCVATDVAARGLDLPDLGLVIHAEIPVNKAGLLHRSGRTGRAGKKGVSVLLVSYTRRRKVEIMLSSAGITAEWSGPPSAEEIRAKDQQRMLADPVLTAVIEDEDTLAMGRQLLEKSSPEQIAAALIQLYRQKLPPPEDVYDDERMKRQQASGKNDKGQPDVPYTDFARGGDMVWYRINIGRDKNADPKWLMPTICRLGHVTKRDIGSIKIFDRETKFEITLEMKAKFEAAIALGLEDGVKIDPAVKPGPSEKPVGKWDKRPSGDRPEKKPWAKREGEWRQARLEAARGSCRGCKETLGQARRQRCACRQEAVEGPRGHLACSHRRRQEALGEAHAERPDTGRQEALGQEASRGGQDPMGPTLGRHTRRGRRQAVEGQAEGQTPGRRPPLGRQGRSGQARDQQTLQGQDPAGVGQTGVRALPP
jgi:superfamily II DNA/RNA helicase